ncbi:MAG: hypothetical protein HRU15_09555, partial [Planctomycetes bacterium]|nr:hypothetical protein [Planctomycetota bacterium]
MAHLTQAQAAEIVYWDGQSTSEKVSYSKGTYSLQSKAENKKIAPKDIFEIRFAKEAYDNTDMQRVFLNNGSIISANVGASGDFNSFPMSIANGQKCTVAGEHVAGIEFSPLNPGAQVSDKPKGAHSISTNGKSVACTIEWMSRRDISIKTRAGRMKLKREKLHRVMLGTIINGTTKDEDIIVRTKYNDKIYAKIVLLDEEVLKIKTIIGNLDIPVHDIVSISSISDRIELLSK